MKSADIKVGDIVAVGNDRGYDPLTPGHASRCKVLAMGVERRTGSYGRKNDGIEVINVDSKGKVETVWKYKGRPGKEVRYDTGVKVKSRIVTAKDIKVSWKQYAKDVTAYKAWQTEAATARAAAKAERQATVTRLKPLLKYVPKDERFYVESALESYVGYADGSYSNRGEQHVALSLLEALYKVSDAGKAMVSK